MRVMEILHRIALPFKPYFGRHIRRAARILRKPPRPEQPSVCWGCKLPLDPYYSVALRGHAYHDVVCAWDEYTSPTVLRRDVTARLTGDPS
jgi:hypothetical protein